MESYGPLGSSGAVADIHPWFDSKKKEPLIFNYQPAITINHSYQRQGYPSNSIVETVISKPLYTRKLHVKS